MLSLFLISLSLLQDSKPPDPEAIIAAARTTQKQLKTKAATWMATHEVGPATVTIHVLQLPDKRYTVVTLQSAGSEATKLCEIIECDGFWYVTAATGRGKYRPFEALLPFASLYLLLERSVSLKFVESMADWKFEGRSELAAVYRIPLTRSQRKFIEVSLRQFELLRKEQPDRYGSQLAQATEVMQESLKKGRQVVVDPATGFFCRVEGLNVSTRISEFSWESNPDQKYFDISGIKWEDHVSDISKEDPRDLIMFSHNNQWQPGSKAGDCDSVLYNIVTGSVRRVPVKGAPSAPGCFLRDRTQVVVSTMTESGIGLVEVDLKTGANRFIAPESLGGANTLMPVLSPDGKRLAVVQMAPTTHVLDVQLQVVDLEKDQAQPIGKPTDIAFVSWLPDAKGFVLVRREIVAWDKPELATIGKMDLEGNFTDLRKGGDPLLLADGKTILFQEQEDRIWKVCDLEGKNVAAFHGGLKGYGFPSLSPDGKRLAMVKFDPQKGPQPILVGIDDGKEQPLPRLPGLWTTPAWK